jgi:hypothetical protein
MQEISTKAHDWNIAAVKERPAFYGKEDGKLLSFYPVDNLRLIGSIVAVMRSTMSMNNVLCSSNI